VLPPREPTDTQPLALVLARDLRPGSYVLRLRASDEVGHAQGVLTVALTVPAEAQPAPFDVDAVEAKETVAGQHLDRRLGAPGNDALVLLVPPREVFIDSVHAQ